MNKKRSRVATDLWHLAASQRSTDHKASIAVSETSDSVLPNHTLTMFFVAQLIGIAILKGVSGRVP